jgi:hypothetical protein
MLGHTSPSAMTEIRDFITGELPRIWKSVTSAHLNEAIGISHHKIRTPQSRRDWFWPAPGFAALLVVKDLRKTPKAGLLRGQFKKIRKLWIFVEHEVF